MTRTGRFAFMLALMAALLVGSPALAQKEKGKDSDSQFPDRLRRLEDLVEKLTNALEKESGRRRDDRRELRERLDRIEDDLARLKGQSSTSRRAFSIDPNPRTRTGTIVIENNLAESATVWIDGTSYRVAAFSTRTLRDQPLGSLQYAVRRTRSSEWGRTTRTTVRAGETLTIDVYEQ